MLASQNAQFPWFKQGWLWVLIGIPFSSVLVCSVLIYYAVTTKDSLVSDHYYKDGLAINQELDLEKAAVAQGIKAEITTIQNAQIKIKLDINSPKNSNIIPFLNLKIIHPTLANKDRQIKLLPESSGAFSSTETFNLTGNWYLEITPQDNSWRLKEEVLLPSKTPILITPK